MVNTVLATKLHSYIVDNNPDLLIQLQSEKNVTAFITNKLLSVSSLITDLQSAGETRYFIEEKCLAALTEDLRPSKYNYLNELLQEEFAIEFHTWRENGTLTYEIINLIAITEDLFDDFNFSEENQEDRFFYYAVVGEISQYLIKAVEKETV